MQTKYVSIHKYIKDVSANKAKKLLYPSLRGPWLAYLDFITGRSKVVKKTTNKTIFTTSTSGVALNWFGVRVRISFI